MKLRPHPAYLCFLPLLLYYAVHALAPEIQSDATTYHLGLAAAWLRDGGFFTRAGHYDVMPHALELLFVPADSERKLAKSLAAGADAAARTDTA